MSENMIIVLVIVASIPITLLVKHLFDKDMAKPKDSAASDKEE